MIVRWKMPFFAVTEAFRLLWSKIRGYRLLATAEEAEDRLLECTDCEDFAPESQQCKICGCYCPAKVLLAPARCPRGRWPSIFKKVTSKQRKKRHSL